ncbi:MAG: hypothetical protein PPP55_10075 [Halorubrum sp.]
MSSETSPSTVRTPIRIGTTLSNRFRRLTIDGLRAVAFWAAIFLPVAYIPAVYGVGPFEGTTATLAVLIAHIVSVVIGHGHNRPEEV